MIQAAVYKYTCMLFMQIKLLIIICRYLLRLFPSDSMQSKALVALIQYFRWDTMAILTDNTDYGKCSHYSNLKDTCYGLDKNSQNQQLLDILACNSANRPSFNKWT